MEDGMKIIPNRVLLLQLVNPQNMAGVVLQVVPVDRHRIDLIRLLKFQLADGGVEEAQADHQSIAG